MKKKKKIGIKAKKATLKKPIGEIIKELQNYPGFTMITIKPHDGTKEERNVEIKDLKE